MLVLRLVIVTQCLGVIGCYLFSSYETESDIYGWLFFDQRLPEALAQTVDNAGNWVMLLAAVALFVGGIVGKFAHQPARTFQAIDFLAAIAIAVWMLSVAVTHTLRTSTYPELVLAEQAVRYAAPAALAWIAFHQYHHARPMDASDPVLTRALWFLIIAAASTFAAHGYKAIEGYGPFVDLILLSDDQWTEWGIRQAGANGLLLVIGIADLMVAGLLLLFRWRVAAFYMTVWGLITASSRVTALGMEAWPETVMRIANGGVPLAILIAWPHFNSVKAARSHSQSPTSEPTLSHEHA